MNSIRRRIVFLTWTPLAIVACSPGPGEGGFKGTGNGWFGGHSDHQGSFNSGSGGDPYGSGGDYYGSGGDPYGSGGDPYGSGGNYYGSGGYGTGSFSGSGGGGTATRLCGSVQCPIDGYICVRHDDGTEECAPQCDPSMQGFDCQSGCCATLLSGNTACQDSTFCCGDGVSCNLGDICVSYQDGTKACGAPCSSNSQCPAGCCTSLTSGRMACAPSFECQ